jgi:proteasome assembly chaperone (PAC2) family protein
MNKISHLWTVDRNERRYHWHCEASWIKGICLLGETSRYDIDAKASKFHLETLVSIFHINMDMSSLEKSVKDTDRDIDPIWKDVRRSAVGYNS